MPGQIPAGEIQLELTTPVVPSAYGSASPVVPVQYGHGHSGCRHRVPG